MNCPNCKKEINDDSKFCIFCGTNVQAAQPKTEENSNRQAQFTQPVQNQQNTEPQQNNTVPGRSCNKQNDRSCVRFLSLNI